MYSLRLINPRLSGVVVREAVRCGKLNCRCAKGEFHRWYYYLYYRRFTVTGWKLTKEYVPKPKVRALRAKIRVAKWQDQSVKQQLKENERLLRSISKGLRQASSYD